MLPGKVHHALAEDKRVMKVEINFDEEDCPEFGEECNASNCFKHNIEATGPAFRGTSRLSPSPMC